MLQAKTIMTKEVFTVRPQDTLDRVIRILIDKNITGIPVVNEDQTLAGIITEKDILEYLLEQDTINRLTDANMCEHTVYHAMTGNVVTFDEETPLDKVCEGLVCHNFRRVPIVDQNARLVGIITRRDLITVIS